MGRNLLYAGNDDRLLTQTHLLTMDTVQWTSPREDANANVFVKPRLHDTTCCQTGCTV